METNCDVTCSQLDSTISSATSLMVQNIIVNPHPLILKDPKKISILKDQADGPTNHNKVAPKTWGNYAGMSITHYIF